MPASLRLTVLVENTVQQPGALAEHGLSFWLETPAGHVLFDTGQRYALVANVRVLDVRLAQARAVVLSHGHFDHTGSLDFVLEHATQATVFAHPAAFAPKFSRHGDGSMRAVGIVGWTEAQLAQRAARVVRSTQPTEVVDGVFVTGSIPRTTDFEDTGGAFFLDTQGRHPDPLLDDQSLYFDSSEGTVVVLGCCHAGLVNTLRYVQDLTHGRPIHAVVGGMHLRQASPERMKCTLAELERQNVQLVAPAHCTGWDAFLLMRSRFGARCQPCAVGRVFEF